MMTVQSRRGSGPHDRGTIWHLQVLNEWYIPTQCSTLLALVQRDFSLIRYYFTTKNNWSLYQHWKNLLWLVRWVLLLWGYSALCPASFPSPASATSQSLSLQVLHSMQDHPGSSNYREIKQLFPTTSTWNTRSYVSYTNRTVQHMYWYSLSAYRDSQYNSGSLSYTKIPSIASSLHLVLHSTHFDIHLVKYCLEFVQSVHVESLSLN